MWCYARLLGWLAGQTADFPYVAIALMNIVIFSDNINVIFMDTIKITLAVDWNCLLKQPPWHALNLEMREYLLEKLWLLEKYKWLC